MYVFPIGIQATALEIVEMNPDDIITNYDEDGNEFITLGERNSVSIAPSELPSFYDTLPSDHLYRVFAAAPNNYSEAFSGFISTYPDGRYYDVFEPTFSLSKEDKSDMMSLNSMEPQSAAASTWFTELQMRSTTNEYKHMYDAAVYRDEDDWGFILKFKCWDNTPFKIEAIGPDPIWFEIWEADANDRNLEYSWTVRGDTTASTGYQTITGGYLYIGIYFPDDSTGRSLFRITPTAYRDQSNSYYDLQTSNTRQPCNVDVNEMLDYLGDVDTYYVDNALTSGVYPIRLTTDAGNDAISSIRLKILREADSFGGTKIMVTDHTFDLSRNKSKRYSPTFDSDTNYFIQIHSTGYTNSTTGDGYTLQIQNPTKPDPYEPNNSFAAATEITDHAYLYDAYLHKGDVDYYKLTVTDEASILNASIFKVNNILYNLSVYDSSFSCIATAQPTGSYNDTGYLKLDPGTYYLKVDNIGLGSSAYFISDSYDLTVDLDSTYSAEIRTPVSLSYTNGQTVNLDDYWTSILKSAYCKVGQIKLINADVTNNSELFIMKGTTKLPLTDTNLATLANGTYTVIMEFFGKPSIGQEISVTVTGSSGEIGSSVVLSTVTMETTTNTNWYWAACAKMIANSRLSRENSALSALSLPVAINGAFGSSHLAKVGTLPETAQLASYFYSGDIYSYSFIESTISMTGIEASILSALENGQAIIAHLENTSGTIVKYIVIYGINTTTHQYKIMDPEGSVDTWIDAEELYSGYGGNADLTFNGQVIECL